MSVITSLDFDPDQVARFLGPIPDIMDAVRRGPAHALVAIETDDDLIGFYVIHPAPADASCWWLGWFAVDRRYQGQGYGALALRAILRHMHHIPGCRRIRLLVAADNARARGLYDRAGFHPVEPFLLGDELVLELTLPSHVSSGELRAVSVYAAAAQARRVFRHRRLRLTVGPHPAWVIGVERGPPAAHSVH